MKVASFGSVSSNVYFLGYFFKVTNLTNFDFILNLQVILKGAPADAAMFSHAAWSSSGSEDGKVTVMNVV